MSSKARAYNQRNVDTAKASQGLTRKVAVTLFWVGLLIVAALAGIAGWELTRNLRMLTATELAATIWNRDGPLFMLWAFSVPLGAALAGTAALLYVQAKRPFVWFTGICLLIVVIVMKVIWSRVYFPPLFGVGGVLILISFFALVWFWMKKYAVLSSQQKVAGAFKLVGYLFWVNASWFLCGETGMLHLKAFEGLPAPSPIEIMVFLVLGWAFVALGEYQSMRLAGRR